MNIKTKYDTYDRVKFVYNDQEMEGIIKRITISVSIGFPFIQYLIIDSIMPTWELSLMEEEIKGKINQSKKIKPPPPPPPKGRTIREGGSGFKRKKRK